MQLPEVHLSVRGNTMQLPDRGLEDKVVLVVVDLNPQYGAHLVSIQTKFAVCVVLNHSACDLMTSRFQMQ